MGVKRITFIEGVRFEQDLLYKDEITRMGIDAHFTVTRPTSQWNGETGRVTELIQKLIPNLNISQTDFYLCGNGNMVNEMYLLLKEFYHVQHSAVFRELFSSILLKKAS